jgi:hypothetical protein
MCASKNIACVHKPNGHPLRSTAPKRNLLPSDKTWHGGPRPLQRPVRFMTGVTTPLVTMGMSRAFSASVTTSRAARGVGGSGIQGMLASKR